MLSITEVKVINLMPGYSLQRRFKWRLQPGFSEQMEVSNKDNKGNIQVSLSHAGNNTIGDPTNKERSTSFEPHK